MGGVATLAAHGLAMSLSLVGITVAVALARRGTLLRLRRASRYLDPVAGALLIAAGAYIAWFWASKLRSGATATGAPGRFVDGAVVLVALRVLLHDPDESEPTPPTIPVRGATGARPSHDGALTDQEDRGER